MTPTLKRCHGRCGRDLAATPDNFHRHAASRDGLKSRCRDCMAADRRDERLVRRLGVADVASVADAYRQGHSDGEAALAARIQDAAAERRARCIVAKVDETLAVGL